MIIVGPILVYILLRLLFRKKTPTPQPNPIIIIDMSRPDYTEFTGTASLPPRWIDEEPCLVGEVVDRYDP